jgi:hypothetical protein
MEAPDGLTVDCREVKRGADIVGIIVIDVLEEAPEYNAPLLPTL